MPPQKSELAFEQLGQPNAFAARRLSGQDQRVEVEQIALRLGRENILGVVAAIEHDAAEPLQR